MPLGTLVRLAGFLMVSTDYLLAGGRVVAPVASDPRLVDRFQRIAQMGPGERETWIGLLDGFLAIFRVFQLRAQSTAVPPPGRERNPNSEPVSGAIRSGPRRPPSPDRRRRAEGDESLTEEKGERRGEERKGKKKEEALTFYV